MEDRLFSSKKIIDEKTQSIIENYSNDIRNLGIVSGTIAPFSLTLLGLNNTLDVNVYSLVSGFVLLLFNIVIAQLFIREHHEKNNKNLAKAEIKWIFAWDDSTKANDTRLEVRDRAIKQMDYIKGMSDLNELLGLTSFNTELLSARARVRKYYKITTSVFLGGVIFIILSILLNPLLILIFKNL